MSTPPSYRPSPWRWLIRLLGLLIIAGAVYRFSGGPLPTGGVSPSQELRRVQQVPEFSLTERSGKTVTNKDFLGKIWVASFIFTTCPGPCPLISANLEKVQAKILKYPDVELVSFTVDPQTDTPPVLAAYANAHHADPDRWLFLTGPEKPLYDLIHNGFLTVAEDNRGKQLKDGEFQVTHGTSLVLVDETGCIRGWFDGVGDNAAGDIVRAIKILKKEEPK